MLPPSPGETRLIAHTGPGNNITIDAEENDEHQLYPTIHDVTNVAGSLLTMFTVQMYPKKNTLLQ